MAEELTLRVITPDKIALDTTASSVRVPALDGSMGILRKHAPMVTALAVGSLSYSHGGKESSLFVSGGFAEVRDDTVRVVTEAGEQPEEIDPARAEKAEERARERISQAAHKAATEPVDLDRAEAALRRALYRRKLVRDLR